jgi:hypothetical protein
LVITLKINPARMCTKMGRKIKRAIKNCQNYIYQFRCKENTLAVSLEVVEGTQSFVEHSLSASDLDRIRRSLWHCARILYSASWGQAASRNVLPVACVVTNQKTLPYTLLHISSRSNIFPNLTCSKELRRIHTSWRRMGGGDATRRIPPRVLNLFTRFKWMVRLSLYVHSGLINSIVARVAKRNTNYNDRQSS